MNFQRTTRLILIAMAFIFAASQHAIGQDAFSEIKLTATANKLMSGNTIIKSWEPTEGIGFEISTPYHFGNLEAGYRYVRFNEMVYENSGFDSHYIFFGWKYSYLASDDVSIATGIRFGKHLMLHDTDVIYGGEYVFSREESEFAYELHFRLQYALSSNLEIFVGTAYNRTIFNIPFAAFYGHTGLSFTFQSPRWVKKLME